MRDELAGAQHAAGIGEFGARLAGAGLGVDPHVGEVDDALARVVAAVGELERRLEAAVRRQLEAPGLDVAAQREAAPGRERRRCTYIGSVCVTEVSSTLGPETSEPSETAARLVTPEIGASTRV